MSSLAAIEAISFDVDGTLWDFELLTRHSLGQVLLEMEWRPVRGAPSPTGWRRHGHV